MAYFLYLRMSESASALILAGMISFNLFGQQAKAGKRSSREESGMSFISWEEYRSISAGVSEEEFARLSRFVKLDDRGLVDDHEVDRRRISALPVVFLLCYGRVFRRDLHRNGRDQDSGAVPGCAADGVEQKSIADASAPFL